VFVGLSLLDECRSWCEQALAALDDAGRGTRGEMILEEAVGVIVDVHQGNGDEVRAAIERRDLLLRRPSRTGVISCSFLPV